MASRRNLKKVITYITDNLATEAFFVSYKSKADAAAWLELFGKIFALNSEYIARANHPEPGMPAKKYYNILCESFDKEAKAILEEMKTLA